MSKLQKFLQSPYPLIYQRWKIILVTSAVVLFILALLQPFGISTIQHNKMPILIGYVLVTALFLSIPVYLFPVLFRKYYDEEKWNVGKYILNNLLIFLFIAIGNSLYSAFVYDNGLSLPFLINLLVATIIVGIFPASLFVLLNRNKLLALHLKEAMEMNLSLQKQTSGITSTGEKECNLVFQSGTKDALQLNERDLLYIEAEGNYIKITFRNGDRYQQKMIRATMRQAEEVTEGCSFIVKCHRAFLVNLHAVSKVSGNSQGYRLSLNACSEEVPVSRAYSKEVKTLIERMNIG